MLAGDREAEALWRAREARVQEILQEANHAALVHMQEWAGWTRTGYHGKRMDGREPGRWERARVVVTTWLQGTNRDGEPHDHSHNVIARMALTESDGKWRAVDTMALRAQLGAMAGIVESRVRSALSREFGVRRTPRADGRGYEIEGIPQSVLDAYSTRTQKVTQKAAQLAREWEAKYGRQPNAREMLFITDEANLASRLGKDDEPIDWDKLAAKWDRTVGGELAAQAGVCDFDARRRDHGPSPEVQEQAIRDALAQVQAQHSTWTKSDLMRSLAWSMGPEFDAMSPDDREAMLMGLADQAITTAYGTVCLEAPEWPTVPRQLIRDLDGRSVYTRPGTERYATRGQLAMEEKLCQQAQRQGAPALTREFAAEQLGADAHELEEALHTRAQDAVAHTRTGLRMDQAAMIYEGVTSGRRISVGVGPAGSGKTFTVAAGARAWRANGGQVIGLTCSQAARNVLAKAGIAKSWNSARFLLEVDKGKIRIAPGTLFVVDEGSMMPTTHLARVTDLAERTGGKILVTGDHQQLAAVESGGAMRLVANHLGFTQLSVPVRFAEEWEREASLRLRLGDQTALEDYNEHGRITGASREEMFAQARQAYVAGRLAGGDMLLMAYTREDCRELSRQIRDDLVHLGLVDGGPTAQLTFGAEVSAGDMIVCRKNDSRTRTDGDHTLANGDIFRVEEVTEGGAMVRRVLEADPDTGAMRLADGAVFYSVRKLRRVTDLAYAVTGHNGQGGTVSRGLALITGHESLEWLYVALTRGRNRNAAMAVTHDGVREKGDEKEAIQPREADPAPGTRPDPELARAERVERERAGLPPEPVEKAEHDREPIAVLADCMERHDSEESATEYQRRVLANADHLGLLAAPWADLAGRADRQRHEQLTLAAVPEEFHNQVREAMTWISRSLRAAELAGLDAGEVIQAAVNSRPLDTLAHAGKGLQARLRRLTDPLVPQPVKPYAERVPDMGDPELQRFVGELAQAQDERVDRLGERAAETSPAWAVEALGPVPDDPVNRLDWTQRAGKIDKYRERYGIKGAEIIGPEPTGSSPDMRAGWFDAWRAMTKTDTADFARLPDESLVHMRDSYQSETGWAPPHVGRQLREVRLGMETMRLQAIRAEAEVQAARDQAVAARHAELAETARGLEAEYRRHEEVLAEAQADRELYDKFSAGPRQIAVQADSEIRKRYPRQKMVPLKSAEPVAPEEGLRAPGWLAELHEQRRAFREELERRQNVRVPDEDPDYGDQGEAWPVWRGQREAILQPPKPEIRPAEAVLEKAREKQAET